MRGLGLRIAGMLVVAVGLTVDGAAQDDALVVRALDTGGTPVAGLLLSAGGGFRAETDADGFVRLSLPRDTGVGDWVRVDIASPSAAEDLVWLTPWDHALQVPPLDEPTRRFVGLVVEERGSPRLLDAPQALVERVVALAVELSVDAESFDATLVATLEDTAMRYELSAYELDEAIRQWGATVEDPYHRGLAALYDLEFAEAAEALSMALEQADAAASAPPHVFTRSLFLGHARWAEGRPDEAASALGRAAEIREDDPRLLHVWGRALLAAGRHADAERALQYALTMMGPTTGTEDVGGALISHTLGRLFQRQGQYARAERFFDGALAIAEPALGDTHPTIGGWLDDMASLYLAQQRPGEAQVAQERSLAIAETWWGADHPVVGDRLNGLAGLHDAQGRLGEAESHFRRALEIAESALGPTHPTVGIRLNNLAMNYQAQRRYEEADVLFNRAFTVLEGAYGPIHPNVAAVLQNHGMLLREMGRPDEGAELERRAVEASGRSRD